MTLDMLGPWGRFALVALAIVVVTQLLHRLLRPVVRRLAGFTAMSNAIVNRCDRPVQWLVPLLAMQLALQGMPEDTPGIAHAQHLVGILVIIAAAWALIGSIRGVADGVIALHPSTVADNLAARRIQTQTRVLSRIAAGAVLIAGLAFVLMTFPRARQLGTSLLASAGVAGLVVGIAAKSVFSNLLAGLQIALAQPIRIDDVLIIEGEWGRVEEITATYVVLKIWDERRLIIPLGWFMEHPFQNWTRRSAQLLGTVFLWVDYTLPVEAIRTEAQRLCEASPKWDKRVCTVVVVDANDRAMQLRILASSVDSGSNFDLRCALREGLIAFIQREYPQALPRFRAEVEQQQPTAEASLPPPFSPNPSASPG